MGKPPKRLIDHKVGAAELSEPSSSIDSLEESDSAKKDVK